MARPVIGRVIAPKLPILTLCVVLVLGGFSCSDDSPTEATPAIPQAICEKDATTRIDLYTPQSAVPDWGNLQRVAAPANTLCPSDAIEISADGQHLYYLFTSDIIENLTTQEILSKSNNTYRSHRAGSPGEFSEPEFYDLGKGSGGSMDGELSFSPDGQRVFFHSNRAENLGYQESPPLEDFQDIYVAEIVNGVPRQAHNLGPTVNSIYPDGEHALQQLIGCQKRSWQQVETDNVAGSGQRVKKQIAAPAKNQLNGGCNVPQDNREIEQNSFHTITPPEPPPRLGSGPPKSRDAAGRRVDRSVSDCMKCLAGA